MMVINEKRENTCYIHQEEENYRGKVPRERREAGIQCTDKEVRLQQEQKLILHRRKIFRIHLQNAEGGDNGKEVRCFKIKVSDGIICEK